MQGGVLINVAAVIGAFAVATPAAAFAASAAASAANTGVSCASGAAGAGGAGTNAFDRFRVPINFESREQVLIEQEIT